MQWLQRANVHEAKSRHKLKPSPHLIFPAPLTLNLFIKLIWKGVVIQCQGLVRILYHGCSKDPECLQLVGQTHTKEQEVKFGYILPTLLRKTVTRKTSANQCVKYVTGRCCIGIAYFVFWLKSKFWYCGVLVLWGAVTLIWNQTINTVCSHRWGSRWLVLTVTEMLTLTGTRYLRYKAEIS